METLEIKKGISISDLFPLIKNKEEIFTFIDLFAGIGGFHLAAEKLGGKCVFAAEWDEKAREVYKDNFYKKNKELFNLNQFSHDVSKIKEKEIPKFDFLFAGFPCQPFSKGGYRMGFSDTRGTLFFDVARILNHHKPSFVLLENVSNLVSHDEGNTFKKIISVMQDLGYALNLKPLVLSPHQFGIPAIRSRIYIPAIRKDLINNDWFYLDLSNSLNNKKNSIFDVIDKDRKDKKYYISKYEEKVLDMWNEFYKKIDLDIIGFPIWADEFNKRNKINNLPKWKQGFIKKNRELYIRNKNFVDKWLKKYDYLKWVKKTHRKMEWQAGKDIRDVYEGLIQFRPSGVRIKRPDKFSTLVAMNHSQIIGKYKRRMTPDETKRLQSFPRNFKVHIDDNLALKQLGNAVNITVVDSIIKEMFKIYEKNRTDK